MATSQAEQDPQGIAGSVSIANNEPIVAYNSIFKLGALATPCLAVAAVSLYGAAGGLAELGGSTGTQLALAAIGGFAGISLLRMAFDRRPVLVIDETGVTVNRPDIGTIPWRAVAGLGITKSVMLRKVLLIAVDESECDPNVLEHAKKGPGLMSMFSPQVTHFQGKMQGRPMINIPVAYLTPSVSKLKRLLDRKVGYHG